jgi:hypothetical protein
MIGNLAPAEDRPGLFPRLLRDGTAAQLGLSLVANLSNPPLVELS